MDKYFHPIIYDWCTYLFMLGLKLNHVSNIFTRVIQGHFICNTLYDQSLTSEISFKSYGEIWYKSSIQRQNIEDEYFFPILLMQNHLGLMMFIFLKTKHAFMSFENSTNIREGSLIVWYSHSTWSLVNVSSQTQQSFGWCLWYISALISSSVTIAHSRNHGSSLYRLLVQPAKTWGDIGPYLVRYP